MSDVPLDDSLSAPEYFRLADEYLKAAEVAKSVSPGLPRPARLLSLHACELFLKAYLRQTGSNYKSMEKFRHDLSAHAECAKEHGLDLGKKLHNDLKAVTDIKHYVAVRYRIRSQGPFSSAKGAIGLAIGVRKVVAAALEYEKPGPSMNP